MKPSKIINIKTKDTKPSITSLFKTKNNNNKNKLLKRHAQLNDTEIKSTQTNTKNTKLNYAKYQPTIEFNNMIKKRNIKNSIFNRKNKDNNIFIHKEAEG